jgi:hypothetical protein
MATGHWMTNRGKLLIAQGAWDDDAAGAIKVGLCKVQGVAADTAVEVADLNTVNDLIVTAGCTECDFTNYVRKVLTRTNFAEDDTNDWAQAVAASVTWTAAGGTTNNTILGAFFYDATTDTNDTTRLLISVDWFATGVPTNGGDYTYSVASGLYRVA